MIADTIHAFQFTIEVNGLNAFECQKFTPSEIGNDIAEHGGANHNVPTMGRVTYTDAVLEKIRPLPGADRWAFDWINSGANPMTGGGAMTSNIARMVVIRELDPSGTGVINTWVYHGCVPVRLAGDDYDRMSSDNLKQRLSIRPTRIEQL